VPEEEAQLARKKKGASCAALIGSISQIIQLPY
jgi:hypothetical protein